MKGKKFYYVAIAVAALLIFSMSGLTRHDVGNTKEAKQPEASGKQADNAVGQKVLSFNLEGLNDRGTKSWEVTGESAEAISEAQVKLDNIVAKAYGDEAEATITADKGIYDKTKNDVRLEQNVHATIDTKEGVKGGFVDISGQLTNAADSKKGQQEGAQKMKRTVITCDGEVQFEYEKNQAFFNKNVKVVTEDGTIDADKITVHLDTKSKKLNDIVAEGNVKIIQGKNITYSDKATYIEADKKVVLTGRPKIVISQEGSDGGLLSSFGK